MKRMITVFIFCLVAISSWAADPDGIRQIKGTITDADTDEPLARCNIYIKGKDFGTVSNNAGEFVLKVPKEHQDGILVISSIGYQNFEKPILELPKGRIDVKLKQAAVILDEVIIPDVDAIIIAALNKKEQNYPDDYNVMTSFYREVVKRNRSYVEVSQGVLNISKSPYNNNLKDKLGIVLGGKSENYKKGDTLAFKVMGGPNVMLLLDIVKNPGVVLDHGMMVNYEYNLHGVEMIDGRRNYVIHFKPKLDYDSPLYSGIIYIDEKSLAIAGLKFGYDEYNLKWAAAMMIKKQPTWVKITPTKTNYEVKYRETNGKWYLDYVRNEIEMKCNRKKRLFSSTFNSVSEMVVTEKNLNIDPGLTRKNTARMYDIFSDKVVGFSNDAYWENYSIIQPEEDLRKALAKIERKTRE